MREFLRITAAALIALQALMSATMTPAAGAASMDAAHMMCAQEDPGPEGRALTAELMRLAGLEGDHPAHEHKDCPVCALAHAAALPEAGAAAKTLVLRPHRAGWPRRIDRASPRRTTGPPVGLRAPPAFI
jgi:hypothetical protein